jgi:hypothetical protein
MPLSEDAKRHLAYRKKTSHRYITGEDGKQRFIDDAKLTTITFVSVAGVHANMVMDKLPDATVTDIEKALLATSEQYGKRETATIGEIVRAIEYHTVIAHAYRQHGKPEDLCGGEVAQIESGPLKSTFLALSANFVAEMRQLYPQAFRQSDSIRHAFQTVAWQRVQGGIVPDGYGAAYQGKSEAAIRVLLLEEDIKSCKEQAQQLNMNWRFAHRAGKTVEMERIEAEALALKKYIERKGYSVKVFQKPEVDA